MISNWHKLKESDLIKLESYTEKEKQILRLKSIKRKQYIEDNYKTIITPEVINQFKSLVHQGWSVSRAMGSLKVDVSIFCRYKKDDPELENFCKKHRKMTKGYY